MPSFWNLRRAKVRACSGPWRPQTIPERAWHFWDMESAASQSLSKTMEEMSDEKTFICIQSTCRKRDAKAKIVRCS